MLRHNFKTIFAEKFKETVRFKYLAKSFDWKGFTIISKFIITEQKNFPNFSNKPAFFKLINYNTKFDNWKSIKS